MHNRKRKTPPSTYEEEDLYLGENFFGPSTYEESLLAIEGPDYDPYEYESDDTDEIRKQKRKIRKLRKKTNTPRYKDFYSIGAWYRNNKHKLAGDFKEGKITKKDLEDKTKLVNKKLKDMKKAFKKEYGLRDKDLGTNERRMFDGYIRESNKGYVSFL